MGGFFAKLIAALKSFAAKLVVVGKPVLIGTVTTGIVLSTTWDTIRDQRGTRSGYSLDPKNANIIMVDDSGVQRTVALSQNQAYIKAYYEYLSCNSYIKLFGNDKYTFKNNTEDFAGLQDYYGKESQFYLNSSFIKMADELMNYQDGKFYFPDQFIKPVYYTTNSEGNVETGNLLNKSGGLAVKSYSYNKKGNGNYQNQSTTEKETGLWDYGMGSVLQYYDTPFQKDQYVKCDYTTVDITVTVTTTDSEGHTHSSSTTYPVSIAGMSGAAARATVQSFVDAHNNDTESCSGPDGAALESLVNGKDHIAMKLEGDDIPIGVRQFNDSKLSAFSNNTTVYPINIPLIKSAACFSGNLTYNYQISTTNDDLHDGSSEDASDAVKTVTLNGIPIHRTGSEVTVQPTETGGGKNPIGYDYLSAYVHNYVVYVPKTVQTDLDFKTKIQNDPEVETLMKRLGLIQKYTNSGSLAAVDGTTYSDDDLFRVAALIYHEAGANDRDRFMVGATFVDRWHAGLRGDSVARSWGNTTESVLGAFGQYYNEATDKRYQDFAKQAKDNGWNSDNNRYFYIAKCCLDGTFAIPQNIYGQAAFTQGSVYLIDDNTALSGFGYTHYYSAMPANAPIADVDWADRDALSAEDAIALIDNLSADAPELNGESNPTVDKTSQKEIGQINQIIENSKETYYQNIKFDVTKATALQQKIANPNSNLVSDFAEFIGDAADQIANFFKKIGNIFINNTNVDTECKLYGINSQNNIEKDIVYSATTFSSDELYSTVSSKLDNNDLSFLFVGDEPSFNLGSEYISIPGIGTTIKGFISPTSSYCSPTQSYNPSTGGVVLSTAQGTNIYSVADNGTVTSSKKEADGTYSIIIEYKSDHTYDVTYKYLATSNVTTGQTVKSGAIVGTSGKSSDGKEAFFFGFAIDGTCADPMNYFYQSTSDAGLYYQKVLQYYPNLSTERKKVVVTALSAIGRIPYFWGGRATSPNWDNSWGKDMRSISAGGDESMPVGSSWLNGLDCSGYVGWVFWSSIGDKSLSGPTAGSQCGFGSSGLSTQISAAQLQPGDIACYEASSDGRHVGIYLYTEDGVKYFVHCSPQNPWKGSGTAHGTVGVNTAPIKFAYFATPKAYINCK